MTTTTRAAGRGWAYAGALLGGGLSVAANIAHAQLRPRPEAFALVLSAAWPILLYVAIEIIAKVAWPRGRAYGLLRWVGLSLVSLVAAIASYRHLSGLLDHYGEDWLTVAIGPLAVDGLMALSTGALIATSRRNADQDELVPSPAAPTEPALPLVPPLVEPGPRTALPIVAAHVPAAPADVPLTVPTITLSARSTGTERNVPWNVPLERSNGHAVTTVERSIRPAMERSTRAPKRATTSGAKRSTDERRRAIAAYLRQHPGAGSDTIAADLGESKTTVYRDIQHLNGTES